MTNSELAIRTLTAAELNMAWTWDEALAASGLEESDVIFIGSPYKILKRADKDLLVNVPFYVMNVRFATDKVTQNEYAVLYLVTNADEQFIVTDGSSGIYQQVAAAVALREQDGHPTPFQNFKVANGLRKSEYGLTKEGKIAGDGDKVDSMGVTYYFA